MQVHPDLLSYLEHRLPADQRREVDAHLAACADCRLALDDMSALVGELTALEPALGRALGRRAARPERTWPAVWRRVGRGKARPVRRPPAWPMTLSVSLMTLGLVWPSVSPYGAAALSTYIPADGIAHAPRAEARQPLTPQPLDSGAAPLWSTSAPLPVATPVPDPTR